VVAVTTLTENSAYSRCVGTHVLMSTGFGHNRVALVACDGEY